MGKLDPSEWPTWGRDFTAEVRLASRAPWFVLGPRCLPGRHFAFGLGAPDGGCTQPGFPLLILKRLTEK